MIIISKPILHSRKMVGGVMASSPTSSVCSSSPRYCIYKVSVNPPLFPSNLKLTANGSKEFPKVQLNLRCNCSSSRPPGETSPGEDGSRTVLDAFFLGKALAEALNERIESTVGEFLSTVGRLQAEQQKQVQEFQEEVLERAKRAKEKAAREAMEAQGLIPKSSAANVSTASQGDISVSSSSTPDSSSVSSPAPNSSVPPTTTDLDQANDDPLLGVPDED